MNVTAYSRREIAAVERFDSPHVVVSITDPMPILFGRGGGAKVPSNAVAVLRLQFWDCDPDALRRNFAEFEKTAEEWNVEATRGFMEQQLAASMTAEHAEAIRDLVEANATADLAVHCEAGISRSAGVAAGLVAASRAFVWANEDPRRFRPNAHVKSLVVGAFFGRYM